MGKVLSINKQWNEEKKRKQYHQQTMKLENKIYCMHKTHRPYTTQLTIMKTQANY